MFRKLAVAATLLITSMTAQAGTNSCIGGVMFTRYGMSAPSSLRSCFPERFTPSYIESVLPILGYTKVNEMTYTSVWKSQDTWLIVVKDRANTYVSEIAMILDAGV